MTEQSKGPDELRAEAEHLRVLARSIADERVLAEIRKMIEELERRAADLDKGGGRRD